MTDEAASTPDRQNATAADQGATRHDPLFGSSMINAAAALGAPAISGTLGLHLQDSRGLVFQPSVDALGRFSACLGGGTFSVVGDRDCNGIYGEPDEPHAERFVTLGPSLPQVDVGELFPR